MEQATRVAALYDVHGNLPALEAVLSDLGRVSPDLVVVGGDVASGPMPAEVLERLEAFGDPGSRRVHLTQYRAWIARTRRTPSSCAAPFWRVSTRPASGRAP